MDKAKLIAYIYKYIDSRVCSKYKLKMVYEII